MPIQEEAPWAWLRRQEREAREEREWLRHVGPADAAQRLGTALDDARLQEIYSLWDEPPSPRPKLLDQLRRAADDEPTKPVREQRSPSTRTTEDRARRVADLRREIGAIAAVDVSDPRLAELKVNLARARFAQPLGEREAETTRVGPEPTGIR